MREREREITGKGEMSGCFGKISKLMFVLCFYIIFLTHHEKGHTVQAGCDGIEDDSKQVQTNQEALKV